MSSTKHSTE